MPTVVYVDPVVVINSVDLSTRTRRVTIDYAAEELDDTASGDPARSTFSGLLAWSMDFEFLQDFDAGSVDATLHAVIEAGDAVTVSVKPTSDATSATNPDWNGNGVLTSYTPIGNSIGELMMAPATMASAGTLARDVS